jgi:hypothetical protein
MIRSTGLGFAICDGLEKYYCGTKKYRHYAKKVVDRCIIYVIFLKYTKSILGGGSWKYTLYIA